MTLDDLPNSCALVAMVTCAQLVEYKIGCRPLAICHRRKPRERHVVTVIYFAGRVHVYNRSGTTTLPDNITAKSTPRAIAEAWYEIDPGATKPLAAEWYP